MEEMREVVVAERSNCMLDVTKLVEKAKDMGISIPEAHEAVRASFERSKTR